MIPLPAEPVRVLVRFVAAQPAGAPCWRVVADPPGPLPQTGIVVHEVELGAAWTERHGDRGSVVARGRIEWLPGPDLRLAVRA